MNTIHKTIVIIISIIAILIGSTLIGWSIDICSGALFGFSIALFMIGLIIAVALSVDYF